MFLLVNFISKIACRLSFLWKQFAACWIKKLQWICSISLQMLFLPFVNISCIISWYWTDICQFVQPNRSRCDCVCAYFPLFVASNRNVSIVDFLHAEFTISKLKLWKSSIMREMFDRFQINKQRCVALSVFRIDSFVVARERAWLNMQRQWKGSHKWVEARERVKVRGVEKTVKTTKNACIRT